jgi:hypothetical protein
MELASLAVDRRDTTTEPASKHIAVTGSITKATNRAVTPTPERFRVGDVCSAHPRGVAVKRIASTRRWLKAICGHIPHKSAASVRHYIARSRL